MADAERIGVVHANAWHEVYRDLLPAAAVLKSPDAAARARQWNANIAARAREVLVAVAEDGVVGFCSLARSRDVNAPAACGEVTALYVEPSVWRHGHGRLLIAAARHHALARRWTELTLWVLATNHVARAFYASQHFQPDGVQKAEGDPPLPEVRYRSAIDGGLTRS
jgi:GNAT superfamily N-acetyltransferase